MEIIMVRNKEITREKDREIEGSSLSLSCAGVVYLV